LRDGRLLDGRAPHGQPSDQSPGQAQYGQPSAADREPSSVP